MQNKEPSEFSRLEGEPREVGEESIPRSKRFRSEDNTQNLESWPVFCYPHRQIEIIQNQGHTLLTAVQHYTEEDRRMMEKHVHGW